MLRIRDRKAANTGRLRGNGSRYINPGLTTIGSPVKMCIQRSAISYLRRYKLYAAQIFGCSELHYPGIAAIGCMIDFALATDGPAHGIVDKEYVVVPGRCGYGSGLPILGTGGSTDNKSEKYKRYVKTHTII